MNSLVTYDYKPSDVDSLFIPIVNEIKFFNKNTFEVFNIYTQSYEKMNIALILFICDMELQVKILKFGHWMKECGCNMCTKSSQRHGRKFYFPTTPLRGTLRTKITKKGVSGEGILSNIPYFNFIKQCPNDSMHVLWCSGVFQKILMKCLDHMTKDEMDSIINGAELSDDYGMFDFYLILFVCDVDMYID